MQEELPLLCENNPDLQNELGEVVCLMCSPPPPSLSLYTHSRAECMYVQKYMH